MKGPLPSRVKWEPAPDPDGSIRGGELEGIYGRQIFGWLGNREGQKKFEAFAVCHISKHRSGNEMSTVQSGREEFPPSTWQTQLVPKAQAITVQFRPKHQT